MGRQQQPGHPAGEPLRSLVPTTELGSPIATVVGGTIQTVGLVGGLIVEGVEGAIKGIGSRFEGIFGK